MAACLVRIENSFVSEVGRPFEKGLSSLGDIVETIDCFDINASAAKVKTVAPLLKRNAKDAFLHMKEADGKAMEIKGRLDNVVQESVNEQGRIRRALADSKSQLATHNSQLESLKSEESQIEAELSCAGNSLESAKCALSDAERQLNKKKKDQKVVAGIGAGLMVVFPGVGSLVGGSMIAASLTALQDDVNQARRSVGKTSTVEIILHSVPFFSVSESVTGSNKYPTTRI